jgi:uncharacterized protein YidB (DUF937 family)
VADLLSQGVTDPSQMLDLLNKTEDGKMVGDFTAKEIKDALTNLMPEKKDNYAGLTSDLKEYYTMKDMGLPLPSAIASLPESQQPFAYVKYKGELERKATGADKEKSFSFSNTNRGELIGTGLASSVIDHIQDGINEYGLQEVLDSEKGLTDAQKMKLTSIVSGAKSQAIDEDYIKKVIGNDKLKKAAEAVGYDSNSQSEVDYYVNQLYQTVETYRELGISDSDILKKLEDKINELTAE